MKQLHRRWLWRLLPVLVLIIFVLVDILRLFTPSGEAAATGFLTYHDSYYGYSIGYPKTWKVAHSPATTTEFVAPGSSATCQVGVLVVSKAMIPQKALLAAIPQGAYAISHSTLNGFPSVGFSHYSSNVRGADGRFTSASAQNIVVAQPNAARGANLYTLSLDMFQGAFVRHNNVEQHTACESNFKAMANSLVLGKGANGAFANVVSNDTSSNPAVTYAETAWDWADPLGNTTVGSGQWQPGFQCAEFVARALSKAGYIGLNGDTASQGAYDNFFGYHLTNVGTSTYLGLYQYLMSKVGAVDLLADPTLAQIGDVVFYYTGTSDDSREHTAIIVDKTSDGHIYVAGHNIAQQHADYLQGGTFNHLSILHLPPPPANNSGVSLFDAPDYVDHGNSLINYQNSNTHPYNLAPNINDNASSLYVAWGWEVTVYQNINGSGGQRTFISSVPDLRVVTFDNSVIINNQISSIVVVNISSLVCSPYGASRIHHAKLATNATSSCGGGGGGGGQVCPNNSAAFISDVSYPDGAPVNPGQSFNKTWQLQNIGSCKWSGFTLNFVSGAQMNGAPSVSVPATNPGQTINITVPLVAPNNGGTYRGNWQLEDSQGVYVSPGGGGTVWVEISVPYSNNNPNNNGADSISASYPTVVTPGQHFQPSMTVQLYSGQLLQSRGDMFRNVDGNLYGAWPFVAVNGTVNPGSSYVFTFYANNPIVAPSSEGTYSSVWQLWQNGTWVGPTYTITFTVKNGGGTAPGAPTLTGPSNWDYERGGATPQLCATSSDSNVQYDFQISQGQSTPDSGWIYGNCWTPTPALGPYTFAWHAKVRDNSSGLESGWSDTWNFSIASQQLSMDPITFSPPSPSAPDGVYVRSCVHGFGDVNLGLSYMINSATDGSANGVWHGFSNAGNNCPDPNNPSTWGQFSSRDYADGDHLVQATGYGPQGQTMIMQATYHLNHRKPQDVQLISPVNNVRVNSDTVTFVWRPSISALSYQLVISANADLSSPLFNQNVGNVSSYQYTFSQDLSPAYWQVTAINDIGQTVAQTSFGIDRVPPTASVTALPATTTDSTFTVTWSGSDNDAGVEWYNVQYRDGNDPSATWVNWQTSTTAIAALFTGQPGHTYYFRAQAMDNASNLSAYAGGNGDTSTIIDLNARPQSPWWNSAYTGKRDLIILNNDTQTLPTGYPIHLHFDASTTPTASDIYSSSLATNPGDDIRIVYQDTTQIPRFLQTFTATQVDIWFNLQASIGPNPATDTTNYQLYYGNASETTPSYTINDVIPEPTDGNTVGLWHFQEGNGSTISDSSGNGYTGSAANMTWTTGKFGPAGSFNGSNAYVNIGNSSAFDPSNITVEAWIYPTNVNGGGEESIIRKSVSSSDGGLIYDFILQQDGVYLRLNGNNGFAKSNTHLQNNQWYHVAASYDGSTIRIYINGVLDNSVSYNVPLRPSSGNLSIGGDGQNNNKYFFGYIQNARISNVARSSFPYGSFGTTLSEPSTNAGSPIAPPQTGTPSLAVQSVNVIPGANNSSTIVVVVQNQGVVATGNGFSTDLYLNHQPTGPGDYTGSVNSWIASPIDSNQNITLATTVTAPGALKVLSSGMPTETTQTYYVQADSSGALSKYDQSNLTITGPISVCTASPDAYEGDNSSATAKPITTNGVAQIHNFNVPGDQDWVSFTAQKGATYVINTSNLGPNADTVLALYGTDGATLLASNDDSNGTLASLINWKAPASGTYYVQVTDWSPFVGGCGTNYDLSIQKSASLTSKQASVTYNQTVNITGKAFTAGESVNLYLDNTSGSPLVTTTASSTGTIATSFVMPQAVLGAHTIYAIGQTSKKLAITPLQVNPKTILSKTTGTQGATISLTGYGFLGYVQDTSEVVNVYWGSSSGTLLGSSPANGQGTSGTINFTVPTVPAGTYTLYIVGQASGATLTVPFKVLPSLTITPGKGAQGSTATVSGTGFGANETVTVQWNCATSTCTGATLLGTVTTDANGNFTGLSITIPTPSTVGTTYAIGARGGTSNVFDTTRFKVTS